jgi:hypothetical protein
LLPLLCSNRLLNRNLLLLLRDLRARLLLLLRDGRLEFGDCALLFCNFGLLFCDILVLFQELRRALVVDRLLPPPLRAHAR